MKKPWKPKVVIYIKKYSLFIYDKEKNYTPVYETYRPTLLNLPHITFCYRLSLFVSKTMLNLYKEKAWYTSVVTNFITADLRAPIH